MATLRGMTFDEWWDEKQGRWGLKWSQQPWLERAWQDATRAERERVFHTVEEIMEHYIPGYGEESLTEAELGKRIAADLLARFRAAIREGQDGE